MNHGVRGRHFGRNRAHRKALLVNLAKEIVEHEQITTTVYKAKDMRPIVEKLVTLARKNSLHARRQALSFFFNDEAVVDKLFHHIAPRYIGRNGGYLRIIKAGFRQGDCAPMAVIEFVDRDINAKASSLVREPVRAGKRN